MTWRVGDLSNNPVLFQVSASLQTGQYTTAARHLASQARYFFDSLESQVIDDLVANFFPVLTKEAPDLQYLQAILSMRMGERQQAIALFKQAQTAYAATHQQRQVVRCYLELAHIYHSSEGIEAAYHYLHDEVQPFIDAQKLNDATLQADFFLQMANIVFDMGQFSTSMGYAKQALALYSVLHNPYGQFHARLQIAAATVQIGTYAEAQSQLQLARYHLAASNLGPLAAMRLLNVQVHLEWYQRELLNALQTAQTYMAQADSEDAGHERVDARLLLGNLYRELGQFRTAHALYMETAKVIKQTGYQSYLPQLQAQLAWLYLLEGRLSNTRALIETNMGDAAQAQAMRFQVSLAILHMLDGEWEKADKLLHESLTFYEQAGDPLACCALHLYLTYNALHRYAPTAILWHLKQGFAWLAEHKLATVPHWWHPKIIAEVCAHALISNLYPELAEQILVQHLGKTSMPVLKLLETTDDIDLRRKAYSLRQSIAGPEANYLAHLPDTTSKQILQELLARGELRPDVYSTLERELTTANHRHSPNPTIIAVFGLYIMGMSRGNIAKQLACSVENVRNYITFIYQYFDLPAHQYKGREARRQKLIKLARERGFIH